MKQKFQVAGFAVLILFLSLRLHASGKEGETVEPSVSSAQTEVNPPKASWPDKIGPFEIFSSDRRHSLRFGMGLQMLVRGDSKDKGAGVDRENVFYEELRRMRASLSGSFIDGLFDFSLQLNTAPNAVEILDYYVGYNPHPCAQIRFGQYKIPFTYYRSQTFKSLTLPDWAITTKYFGAERQFGIAVQSDMKKVRNFDYAFGIFTGANARASHALGMALLYGETVVNRSSLVDFSPRTEFNPELVMRFGYNHNGVDISRDTDFKRGPAGFHLGISATYDPAAEHGLDFAARLSPEFLFKARGFSMSLAGYFGWGERFTADPSTELAMTGGHVQMSYLVTDRLELAARYAVARNSRNFREDARRRADELIEAAQTPEEAADLSDQYKNAGTVAQEHEVSLGVNVYIIGEYLKLQNDVSFLFHDLTGSNREDIRGRSQLLLAF
jgi:hypothetical protein